MSQHRDQYTAATTIRIWLLAGGAALALGACSSTSYKSGSTGSEMGSFTEQASFEAMPADGRFVGLFGEMEDQDWGFDMPDGQSSLMQVSFASEGSDFDPEIDPSGEYMVFASTQHARSADIYRKKIEGKTLVRLTSDSSDDVMPAISPDGKWIAFASNRSGNWDIWMMPFKGGPATQITFESDHELHPSFSPDGSQITYCRRNQRSSRWEIWSFDVDSPGTRMYVCDGMFPQWCPDSSRRTILFQRARDRGSQYFGIWTVDFHDGTSTNPTEIVAASSSAIMHPSWSPSGELICYCTVDTPQAPGSWPDRADVWMISIDGTGRAPLTTGSFRNMQPTWSKDGRIFFVSDRGGNDTIWAVPAAASASQPDNAAFATAGSSDNGN